MEIGFQFLKCKFCYCIRTENNVTNIHMPAVKISLRVSVMSEIQSS
jgi:hypothetical protein